MVSFNPEINAGSVVARINNSLRHLDGPLTREAKNLQESQLDILIDRVEATGREQRNTTYLERALVSPDNRVIDQHGFTVGGGLALSKASPYFRFIDQGTDIFVGRVLAGWFLEGGKRTPPGRSRRAERLIQLRQNEPRQEGDTRHGLRNTAGRFRTVKPKEGETPKKPGGKGAFLITIRNPIPAYHYIEAGFEAWLEGGAIERLERDIRAAVRKSNR